MVNGDDLKYKGFLKKYEQFRNPYVFFKHFLLQLLNIQLQTSYKLEKCL